MCSLAENVSSFMQEVFIVNEIMQILSKEILVSEKLLELNY